MSEVMRAPDRAPALMEDHEIQEEMYRIGMDIRNIKAQLQRDSESPISRGEEWRAKAVTAMTWKESRLAELNLEMYGDDGEDDDDLPRAPAPEGLTVWQMFYAAARDIYSQAEMGRIWKRAGELFPQVGKWPG